MNDNTLLSSGLRVIHNLGDRNSYIGYKNFCMRNLVELGLMTEEIVSPDGYFEFTVTDMGREMSKVYML